MAPGFSWGILVERAGHPLIWAHTRELAEIVQTQWQVPADSRPFAPTPRHLASLVVADAFAGELTRGSFKTIPATQETTNTQRFEVDSLAGGPGFEP